MFVEIEILAMILGLGLVLYIGIPALIVAIPLYGALKVIEHTLKNDNSEAGPAEM